MAKAHSKRNRKNRRKKNHESQRLAQPESLEDRRLLTIVPAGLTPGDPYYLAFTTSRQTLGFFPGHGTGVPGADSFVQSHQCTLVLNDSACSINYKAIISDSGAGYNANNDLGLLPGVPIYNSNGDLMAPDLATLWSGSLVNPNAFDENGVLIQGPFPDTGPQVWTGTNSGGTATGVDGLSWTGNDFATHGDASRTDSQWIDQGSNRWHTDAAELHAYGISMLLTAPGDGMDQGSVHGIKFEDLNGNGIQDEGEVGLAGWEFYADLDGNGMYDDGEPIAMSMDDGSYWLEGIPAGTWEIRERPQSGWAQTVPINSYTVTIGLHQVDYTYTTDNDFDQGDLDYLNHDSPNNDQLQIDEHLGASEPIIWLSNSNEGTVSKFDTQTGDELGRYRTGPTTGGSPSRVAVLPNGDVWVANRSSTGGPNIIKIKHEDFNDNNSNSIADTSTDVNSNGEIDPGEILAWGTDERVDLMITAGGGGGGARGLAVDPQGRLWVGLRDLNRYEVYDGTTGAFIAQVPTPHGPYGAVIDKSGILWSAGWNSPFVDRIDTNTFAVSSVNFSPGGGNVYGITVDRDGVVWASTWSVPGSNRSVIKRYDPNAVLPTVVPFTHPNHSGPSGGGITVDRNGAVWTPGRVSGGDPYAMLKYVFDSAGALDAAQSTFVPTPSATAVPKAASVDADGFVWTTTLGDQMAHKIDPVANTVVLSTETGLYPYNYSDMTGDVRASSTTPQGTWTVTRDSNVAGMVWTNINWNNEPEASLPAGTQVVVEARAADSPGLLPAQSFVTVANNTNPGVTGRYVEVRVTLIGFHDEDCVRIDPVFSDLNIKGEVEAQRFEGMNFGNARAASAHGTKWLDVDRDGVMDPGEPGLAEIVVYADLNHNGVYDEGLEPTAVTMADDPNTPEDETGMWWLEGLPPGEYRIGEVVPEGPFAGYEDGLEQTFPGGNGFHHVFLEPGGRIDGLKFGNGPKPPPGGIGNSPPGSVHGWKWYDENGNGQWDDGEPGVAGVTIFVDYNGNGIRDDDEPFAVTMGDDPTTDEDETGMYWLEGVRPGEWTVYEELPNGYVQTFPMAGSSSGSGFNHIRLGDADGFGYTDGATWMNAVGDPVNVDGVGTLGAGDFLPDRNQNGLTATFEGDDFDHRTAAETAGTEIQGSGFTDLGSTGSQFTDLSLSTSFDDSFPNNDFPLPPSSSLPNQPGFEFDFFVANGDILAGADVYLNVVFGDYDIGTAALDVSSAVTSFTTNLNNQQLAGPGDDGGIRAAFATLPFYDVFQPVAGGYQANLDIDFVAPTEPFMAFDFVEISMTPISQSQVSPGHTVVVIGNQHVHDVNYGNTRACSAHGLKWEDLNGNGARDPGEVGLPGVTIFWDQNNNGELDPGEPTTLTMEDDPNTPEDETGKWWIDGVPAGTHVFRELLPDGSVSTTGAVTITIEPGCGDEMIDVNDDDVVIAEDEIGIWQLAPADAVGVLTTVEIVAPPEFGEAIVTQEGLLQYTPAADFNGLDQLQYRLVGPGLQSNVALLGIEVTPVNDAPRFDGIDPVATGSDTPITVDVLSNSSDVEGDDISVVLIPSSSTLPPYFGNVVLNDDGSFTYTPDAGYAGMDSVMFILADQSDTSHAFQVDIEVAAAMAADGDFNTDGLYDCADIDSLVAAIASSDTSPSFDLNADGLINGSDLDQWLVQAGEFNMSSDAAYLYGDANLDGAVDVGDFNVWNSNKFTANPSWCNGDFNADGVVDISDYNLWNNNKFQIAADPVGRNGSGESSRLTSSLLLSRSDESLQATPNQPTRNGYVPASRYSPPVRTYQVDDKADESNEENWEESVDRVLAWL